MTTVAHSSELRRPGRRGLAARRPLIRWAWRLFRREWRQQILVIALLTVAVTAAVTSVTIAYNSGPLDYAEFGSANALLRVGRRRSAQAGGKSRRRRGTVRDDRRHRPPLAARPGQRRDGGVPGPGPARTVRRACAPPRAATQKAPARSPSPTESRRFSGSKSGRLSPSTAVAEPSSASSRTHVSSATSSPSSHPRPPEHRTPSRSWSTPTMEAISRVPASAGRPVRPAVGFQLRGHYEPAPELAMFSVATVFMLLASLVATAGFAVIAQRRLRQLGMLAAIGATEKHLRLVLLTNGAVVGAIGALIGTSRGSHSGSRSRRRSSPRSTFASTGSASPGHCSR